MDVVNEIVNQYQPKERIVYSDKWDDVRSIPVIDFVSQYVDLKESGSGAVGLCPFHDDTHHSFSISETGNYWNCFAGCGGGSVIEFWMKLNNCDFKTAITELEKLVGG